MTDVLIVEGGSGAAEFSVESWVPGNPAALREIANRLREQAKTYDTVSTKLTTTIDPDTARWDGTVATDFRALIGELPGDLCAIARSYRAVAQHVDGLADTVEELQCQTQDQVHTLVDQRHEERRCESELRDLYNSQPDDVGAIDEAQRRLGAARDASEATITRLGDLAECWYEACSTCASEIDAAEPEAVRDRDFLSQLIETISDANRFVMVSMWRRPDERGPVAIDDPDLNGFGEYEDRNDQLLYPYGDPNISDIDQGGIGDCWLLATLAGAVRGDPDRVKNLITDNGNGTYTVTFADGQEITVDTDVSTASGGNALWVALIEKAYAERAGGGYDDIHWDSAGRAYEDLFGSDIDNFDPNQIDYDAIATALDNDQIVVASTSEFGLGGNHALTVLDVNTSDGEQYITIRNPWGGHGQMGDPLREAGAELLPDGVSRIPMDLFVEEFHSVKVEKR